MNQIINSERKKTLDIRKLKHILPRTCKVAKYDDLLKCKTLKDAMGTHKTLVILFNVHDSQHRILNEPGHFFCISVANPKDGVVYFSSTGMSPEHEIFLTQSDPKLLQRILPKNFKYNDVELQKGKDTNTCWRWIVVFVHMAEKFTLKMFQKVFGSPSLHVNSSDDLVVLLTLMQLF